MDVAISVGLDVLVANVHVWRRAMVGFGFVSIVRTGAFRWRNVVENGLKFVPNCSSLVLVIVTFFLDRPLSSKENEICSNHIFLKGICSVFYTWTKVWRSHCQKSKNPCKI